MCNFPLSFFRFYDGTTKICGTGVTEYLYKGVVYKDPLKVPCGKCIECRLNYARQWSFRLQAEMLYHEYNSFITLTYDDNHVPLSESGNLTLRKSDFQKFMKRLRKNTGLDISYYACCEYGEHTLRPHYHAIIFGWFPDDLVFNRTNKFGNVLYTSPTLQKLWPFGFSLISEANVRTGGYCARYCTKKLTGPSAILAYDQLGIERPSALMSRRPAIGYQYFIDHIDDLIKYDKLSIATADGVLTISPPKYFFDKLQLTHPDIFDNIKERKEDVARFLDTLPEVSTYDSDMLNYYHDELSAIRTRALKRGEI